MRKLLAAVLVPLLGTVPSCGTEDGGPTEPVTGMIEVALLMSGSDVDVNGCTFIVDSGSEKRLNAGQHATFSDLSTGAHVIEIGNVAGNCRVDSSTSRSVTVVAGQTSQETFTVVCEVKSRIAFRSVRNGNGVYVMNPDGTGLVKLTGGNDSDPAWSPDGSQIAFSRVDDSGWGIWVMNADGTGQVRLTSLSRPEYDPTWSPNGTRIAFSSQRDGNFEIYVMSADGTDQINLTNYAGWDGRPAWSPNGARLAFVREHTRPQVYEMSADGTDQTNLTNHPSANDHPAWSPDGSRLAFDSERDGNGEIYVMNSNGSGQVNLTNLPGSEESPTWSPDGTRLAFYCNFGDGNDGICVMNVDGTGLRKLTSHPGDHGPAWSPEL